MNDEAPNQPPPLEGYDAFTADPWIGPVARRLGVEWVSDTASALGRFVGSAEGQSHAALANRHVPELRTHDRYGARIDAVEYHPSYHALMERALSSGVHSLAWKRVDGGFAARAVLFYLWNQLEQGTACPVTMTFASIPMFAHAPDIAAAWRGKVLGDAYDPRPVEVDRKAGATIGMAMTEKQGGSDLRAVQTEARRDGATYTLEGHKWFCSAPMSDAFFTLARLPEGVSCFFVPRSLPGGARNDLRIQRLKDKCGNRSNASAEIEYHGTVAWPVGEPGRGIATLIEMAHHTRFDITVGIAGMMRQAVSQAIHHARHRSAFGKLLAEHELMAHVLADLALEAEAAMLLAFRLAAAFDASPRDARERELQRVLTPIAKYWLCKRMTPVAVEAMECLGGNGYVEEGPLARLFREAPLNGIWEGSANVICLDALRAIARSKDSLAVLMDEIAGVPDPRIAKLANAATRMLADTAGAERNARSIVEALAICMQASLMKRHAHEGAAHAFCAGRLEAFGGRHAFGTLPGDIDVRGIVERAALRA
ncbi:MAG: acyl-CoA dehydrogenase family protein [Usitatibacter sp.]